MWCFQEAMYNTLLPSSTALVCLHCKEKHRVPVILMILNKIKKQVLFENFVRCLDKCKMAVVPQSLLGLTRRPTFLLVWPGHAFAS